MTGSTSGWPAADDFGQFVTDNERNINELKRRTRIPSARQIMGPGLGPYAVQLFDWNDPKTLYNGVFYSEDGAANAPGSGVWIGSNWCTPDGRGIQTARALASPTDEMVRTFVATPSGTPTFTAWVTSS